MKEFDAVGLLAAVSDGVGVVLGGVVLGALLGGGGFWAVAFAAITAPASTGSLFVAFLFAVSFVGFLGSFVTPVIAASVLGGLVESPVRRALVTAGAYLVVVPFVLGVTVVALDALSGFGVDGAAGAYAALNAVFGVVVGGVVGGRLAAGRVRG